MKPFSYEDGFPLLTDRERQVLECIAQGLSSKEAAQQLNIAPRTVERHVENLRNKMRARNKTHMVAKALANGQLHDASSPKL
jgi:LuxR family transcriptional regulator, transcriptional regulator of spore coat protein